MPIVITATIDLEPGRREQTLRSARPFIDAALGEPGCRAYTWSLDADDPDRVRVFEEWADEPSLKNHFEGEPYAKMRSHLAGSGIRAAVSAKYRVDLIEPVYDETGMARAHFFSGGT